MQADTSLPGVYVTVSSFDMSYQRVDTARSLSLGHDCGLDTEDILLYNGNLVLLDESKDFHRTQTDEVNASHDHRQTRVVSCQLSVSVKDAGVGLGERYDPRIRCCIS